MAKSVVKEIIIALLLCLAIILVLGILLYEYAPMSKTIPNPVSYQRPQEVQEELASSDNIDESKVIMTYEVDSSDLNSYERTQDYVPGKANPFSSYVTSGTDTNGSGSSNGGSTNSGSNSSSGSGSNSGSNSGSSSSTGSSSPDGSSNTSGGHYFKDKGTK